MTGKVLQQTHIQHVQKLSSFQYGEDDLKCNWDIIRSGDHRRFPRHENR